MEHIMLTREIATAVLAFRSKDKTMPALQNIQVLPDQSLVATDGARLLLITRAWHANTSLTPGIYKVVVTGKDGRNMSLIGWEKVEDQYPDVSMILKDTAPLISEGKQISFVWNGKSTLPVIAALYKVYKSFDIALNPALSKDLPPAEYSLHGTPDRLGTPIEYRACSGGKLMARALFVPFKIDSI